MKIIFVISPDYLEPLFNEAKKYDFKIQGYSTIQEAAKGLIKTNVYDILGFTFVSRTLPKDSSHLKSFLSLCNSMNVRKKFLFALNDNSRLHELFTDHNYSNLDISYLNAIEVMTDIEINQNIFGSILKYNYAPYKLDAKQDSEFRKTQLPRLEYKPVINKYPLKVVSTVYTLESYELTLARDLVYIEYNENENPDMILCKLRELYVKLSCLISIGDITNDSFLNDYYYCSKLIDDSVLQNNLFCIYKTLLYIIKSKWLSYKV